VAREIMQDVLESARAFCETQIAPKSETHFGTADAAQLEGLDGGPVRNFCHGAVGVECSPHEHRFREVRRPSREVGKEVDRWPGVKHSAVKKERFDPGYFYEPDKKRSERVEADNKALQLKREQYRGQRQKDFSKYAKLASPRLRAQVFTDAERVNEAVEKNVKGNDEPYMPAPTFIFRPDANDVKPGTAPGSSAFSSPRRKRCHDANGRIDHLSFGLDQMVPSLGASGGSVRQAWQACPLPLSVGPIGSQPGAEPYLDKYEEIRQAAQAAAARFRINRALRRETTRKGRGKAWCRGKVWSLGKGKV